MARLPILTTETTPKGASEFTLSRQADRDPDQVCQLL